MAEELQELQDLVAQLRADNERLRQEQTQIVIPGPSTAPISTTLPSGAQQSAGASAPSTERFVFVPRDRKCPKFSGRPGITINEWVEEAQACMRVRHLSRADQAFFLFDHLEGEARDEIRYRSETERGDPDKIIRALKELYGCSLSYVALQQAFFSRRQQEGETLLEFSIALMGLLEGVKQQSPHAIPNAEALLRDQFVEHVLDIGLRRELKQLVRRDPTSSLLDVRSEAMRWEREGMPGGARGRSQSVPVAYGAQYAIQGESQVVRLSSPPKSELAELREMLKSQQEQLNQLTQGLARLQVPNSYSRSPRHSNIVCRRCQQSGHFARECDGERVLPRAPAVGTSSTGSRQFRSSQPSEN